MNDRLNDLYAELDELHAADDCENSGAYSTPGSGKQLKMRAKLPRFIKQVNRAVKTPNQHTDASTMIILSRQTKAIEDSVDAIKLASKLIRQYDDRATKAITSSEESEISSKIRQLVGKTNAKAMDAAQRLELLRKENKRLRCEQHSR